MPECLAGRVHLHRKQPVLLETAERYITLGILVFTVPVVFALGAWRSTNNIFRSWCRIFGSQLFWLMNAWCLKLFTHKVAEVLANPLALGVRNGKNKLRKLTVTLSVKGAFLLEPFGQF